MVFVGDRLNCSFGDDYVGDRIVGAYAWEPMAVNGGILPFGSDVSEYLEIIFCYIFCCLLVI